MGRHDQISLSESKRNVTNELYCNTEEEGLSEKHAAINGEFSRLTPLILEQISVSFALAQSAKISVFETMVNNVVKTNRGIPYELATKGRISIDLKDISKRVGQLFMV